MPLCLHAKTYINIEGSEVGDEHYIYIPEDIAGVTGRLDYNGTGWDMVHGEFFDDQTPAGGYINVTVHLVKHVIEWFDDDPLDGATMTLSGSYSYWGFGRPTSGSKSASWSANLLDTEYKLTRVTV
jgi:hypothetical protein